MKIKRAGARKIFDSFGRGAVEVEINIDDKIGRGICNSGLNENRFSVCQYPKQGVGYLTDLFNKKISAQLVNLDINGFGDLKKVEDVFKVFDVTDSLDDVGGSIIVASEYAILKAASNGDVAGFLNKNVKKFPGVMFNIVSGGKYGFGRGADFQEFLILPKTRDVYENVSVFSEIYEMVRRDLMKRDKGVIGKGLKGGFNIGLINNEVLHMLSKIVDKVGKENKIDIELGIDVAGNNLWNGRNYEYKRFSRKESKRNLSRDEQIEFIGKLKDSYNLVYIEDPLHDDDFDGFHELNKGLGIIAGDDLIASRVGRLKEAVRKISAAAIKPNHVGSLLKTKEAVDFALDNKIIPVLSCNDNICAHLAVGWSMGLMKVGLDDVERLNSLLRIKENLNV